MVFVCHITTILPGLGVKVLLIRSVWGESTPQDSPAISNLKHITLTVQPFTQTRLITDLDEDPYEEVVR